MLVAVWSHLMVCMEVDHDQFLHDWKESWYRTISMRQVPRPDAKVNFGIGGIKSSFFAQRRKFYGSGAHAGKRRFKRSTNSRSDTSSSACSTNSSMSCTKKLLIRNKGQ